MAAMIGESSFLDKETTPPLENGDHLSASEFLRRFEAMPDLKKAELIQGIVTKASPVRTDVHGEPDALIQTWLGLYAASHPNLRAASNVTLRLGPDDVPQPDAVLFLNEGGKSHLDEKGYLCGSPELVVEIAASSASIDAQEKLVSYRRAGIPEYLLWRVLDSTIEWFVLENDEYVAQEDSNGVFKSRVFPDLELDALAALKGDRGKVLSHLQAGLKDRH